MFQVDGVSFWVTFATVTGRGNAQEMTVSQGDKVIGWARLQSSGIWDGKAKVGRREWSMRDKDHLVVARRLAERWLEEYLENEAVTAKIKAKSFLESLGEAIPDLNLDPTTDSRITLDTKDLIGKTFIATIEYPELPPTPMQSSLAACPACGQRFQITTTIRRLR